MPLTAEILCSNGMFLLDIGESLILWIGQNVSPEHMKQFFGKTFPHELREFGQDLPEVEGSVGNARLREFIDILRTNYWDVVETTIFSLIFVYFLWIP